MISPAFLKTESKALAVAASSFSKNAEVLPKSAKNSAFASKGVKHSFGDIRVYSDDKLHDNLMGIQPKLKVNQIRDDYELEADAMADRVMGMPDPLLYPNTFYKADTPILQRKCAHCEKEEKEQYVHRKENHSGIPQKESALEDYVSSLDHAGAALSIETRSFFEPRFGYDFSNVKVHTDPTAAKSAQSINALAYTKGNNIVFNNGQYAPETEHGKKLIGHELTHVVQQRNRTALIQRQMAGPHAPVDIVDQRDGAPNAVNCGPVSGCPTSFCEPYPSQNLAIQQRARMTPILLAGIAAFVNSRVVPLWATYLSGGSSTQNLTSQFGADFTASPTTITTTRFLTDSLRASLTATRPVFPAGSNFTVLDLSSRISAEITAINTPGNPYEMNFNFPSDIAGNIAGGIGTDQSSCQAGARPSPFNDARIAQGTAHISRDAAGNLTVIPIINYQVRDTIDLCPGNCGTSREQIATIPMSQFEATGIAGDVPFTIDFPSVGTPFTIPHP